MRGYALEEILCYGLIFALEWFDEDDSIVGLRFLRVETLDAERHGVCNRFAVTVDEVQVDSVCMLDCTGNIICRSLFVAFPGLVAAYGSSAKVHYVTVLQAIKAPKRTPLARTFPSVSR